MAKALTLALMLALAGCGSLPGGTFCDIASPKRYSAQVVDAMTDAEVKDTLAHNRKGQKLCGWRP